MSDEKSDEDAITKTLREAGPRYVVDARQRLVGYLLTPEEYADYLDMLEDRADSQDPEIAQRLAEAAVAHKGVPGTQLLPFAGAISAADLLLMQQAIETECEAIDAHEW
ncbi:MAG TPA: hypothetical protein P5195_03355 [Anaerolineae bacterium]|nr:hypothetical protein [Anaerolineae bacterium]HRU94255.1 hypothetical protein [Anaerolineae bacterium]HXK43072.1 hypothetical protein [Anaerolineae bacterium]